MRLAFNKFYTVCVVTNGDAAEVTTLLEAGASTDVRDKDGRTPLHYAFCEDFGGPEAVAVLLKAGASMDVQDEDGQTPLDLADFSNADLAEKFGAKLPEWTRPPICQEICNVTPQLPTSMRQ